MLLYSTIMFIVAAMFLIMGIAIYKGKTNLIHDYHQIKVKDKVSYGKAFGKAMLVNAAALLLSGIIGLFEPLAMLATIVLAIGLTIGITCIVIVQRKYNKGMF